MDPVRDELVRLLQDYAGEADRLTQTFAERNGMHPTDLYALLAIMRADVAGAPLTPGRLGEHLGLSSGATTAVIDRLERVGHVRRAPDPRDGRRVIVHRDGESHMVAAKYFGPLGVAMDAMLASYDAAELETVRRFLDGITTMMREHRRAVAG